MTQEPIQYSGVMISSTFNDLKEHRQALIKTLNDHGLMHIAMENSPARADVDLIESSYRFVRNASAYILVIGRKYGQTPDDAERNPKRVSITELEFAEANRLGRPVLLFLMGKNHRVREADIELNSGKRRKLSAFRERAKKWSAESSIQRVYAIFDSLEEFKDEVGRAVPRLKQSLDTTVYDQLAIPTPIILSGGPRPPQLYTNSTYLSSHQFVGREDQLRILDEWAQQSDTHSVFLFEAIGGSGKSILTWHWLINRSSKIHVDWAGRFWYSFYERGAETRGFLIQALSYMTGQPHQQLQKKAIRDLGEQLLCELRARSWLVILDGIERLLVHYHRFDAAHANDDEAGTEDRIGRRHPLATIRDEDSELFRSFLTAAPSKLLLTSRLTPRCLINTAHQPLPGLLHQRLPGLRPEDAELLFRSCGAYGDSQAIRSYLKENCDCHPLVVGFIAGLVNRYLPARGNFDAWVRSQNGGLALNLAALDLVQRRNHILQASIEALSDSSRELLATVAMVSSSFDYRVLTALSPALADAQHDLQTTVIDLEERGLLLFDRQMGLYDLHPVVRGVVAGGLGLFERERLGGRVIDFFSTAAARHLGEAETLDDLQSALNVVHTYLAMGKLEKAWQSFRAELSDALRLNFEAYEKSLAILRPFFTNDWSHLHKSIPDQHASQIFNRAGTALMGFGLDQEAFCSHTAALLIALKAKDWSSTIISMLNIAQNAISIKMLSLADKILEVCVTFSEVIYDDELIFLSHLGSMKFANIIGNQRAVEDHWHQLDPLGRAWCLSLYRPGEAEAEHLTYQLHHDCLIEADLQAAENIAAGSRASRRVQRKLHRLRGEWRLKEKQYALAVTSLETAGRMARECGLCDAESETLLAQAKYLEGTLADPREEAERLSSERDRSELQLALLWEAIGDGDRALAHARNAFELACADGEPYVYRKDLNRARSLVKRLSGEEPKSKTHVSSHDQKILCPSLVEPDFWLRVVGEIVEGLRVENNDGSNRYSGKILFVTTQDSVNGLDACYYLLVKSSKRNQLNSAIRKGSCDLSGYGEIIASCYGKTPNNRVREILKNEYNTIVNSDGHLEEFMLNFKMPEF